jgi:LysR family transcriptional regulator, hydrogen peroxide-inducible genes activator
VALSETLHFRRAAEISGVTQPTLSGQLQELERSLGAKLVERGRGKVIFTPAGIEVANRARSVLRDVEALIDCAKSGGAILSGTIRLGTLHSLGPYLLPHVLPELHAAYPKLRMHIREAPPKELLQGLESGNFDALLFPLPVNRSELQSVRLFREPLLVAVLKDHVLSRRAPLESSQLKGATVLALEHGHRLREQVIEICERYGAQLSLDYEGTSLDTLRQMVELGMGIAFLPALYVRAELSREGRVTAVPIATKPPSRIIGLLWRRRAQQQAQFEAIASLIRACLKAKVPEVQVIA